MADPLDLLGAGLDVTQPVAGADLLGGGGKKPSAIAEGFRGATAGAKASLAGFGALAASTIGADTAKQAALQTAAEQQAISEEHTRRVEDVNSAGGGWEHYKYLLGSAAPTLALMLAAGLVGRGTGGFLTRGASAAARAAAQRVGGIAGAVSADVPLEAGEIYTSALAEGTSHPELRAAAGGALAASLDFIPLLAADRYIKAAGKGGFGAVVKGAAKGAPVGAVLEGGQEAAQAVIERGFAGKSLTDGEAVSDYLNSFLGGAAPGVLFGGATGASRGRAPAQAEQPAPLLGAPERPLPDVLSPEALDTRVQDTALLGSLADAQGGELPLPLSTTGPQQAAEPVADRFNRAAAPVAEDADLTDRAILVDQRDTAQARLTEIGSQMAGADRRTQALLTREAEGLTASLPALETQIGVLDTQIGNRVRMGLQPEVPAAAERTGSTEGVVLGEQQAPDTTEAERAIAQQVQALGGLVDSRQAQLLRQIPATTTPALAVEDRTAPRSSERTPNQKTLTGAMIEAGRQVAAQDLPGIVKARAEGVMKKPTPEQDKVRERAIRDAVDSVIADAAAQPSVEQAQAHVMAELPKAVKGRLDAKTAGELADRVSRGLAQAPRYYSKAAISPTVLKDGARERLLGKVPKEILDKVTAWGKAGGRLTYQDISELVTDVQLTDQQRAALRPSLTDEFATRYETRIATALEAGYTDRAQRWVERYDRSLVASSLSSEIRGDRKFIGTKHPQATTLLGALSSLRDLAQRIRENGEEQQDRAHLSIVPGSDEQRSVAATDASQDVYDQVLERKGQDAIKRFAFLYGNEIEQFDLYLATEEQPNAGYYQAMQGMKDTVGFAMNATNLPSVADHEAFHALEQRKLDARERAILSRAFQPGQPLFQQLLARAYQIDREMGSHIADEIMTHDFEARAYGFQAWRAGDFQVDGAVATIFAKLKEFLQRVANMLRGQGFQSVEDIFRAIDRGAYAQRAARAGGNVFRYAERDPADPVFAPDFPSFFALMQSKFPQFNYGKWKELPNGDLRFPYALDFSQQRRSGQGTKFLRAITDWLDIQGRGSYIIAVPENPAEFSQEDLVKMYERRGWVVFPPEARTVPVEEGIEMYRQPKGISDERVSGEAEQAVRAARARSDGVSGLDGTSSTLPGAGEGDTSLDFTGSAEQTSGVAAQKSVPLSLDERAFFESVFASAGDVAELREQVPSIGLTAGQLTVSQEHVPALEDYISETWALEKREHGGQGAASLPKSFAAAGAKFIQKLRSDTRRYSRAGVDLTLPRPPFLNLSGRDLDRAFEEGKLPREQELRIAAQMFDPEQMPDATAKQLYGATHAEMGKLQEFWHKHFASGNYLSRFSQGYRNVQQALSTFTQRKSQLFAHAVNVQMSEWVNANDGDIQGASDAIFKATVGGIRKNSAEYMSLFGALSPKQQAMFRQVFGDAKTPGVIADMLQKEFEADSRDMQAELPPAEFAEWLTNRRTRVQKLIEDSYVPERRYGDYTVKIFRPASDGQNVVLFYEQFESRGEAALTAQRYEALLKEKGVESLRVEFGTRHAADRDTSLSLRQFFSAARRHGVELTQVERQRIARALVSADSARLNRIMRRKNIPGHSQDGLRVLSEFALTMASKIAHSEFTDAIEASLQGRAVDAQVVSGKPVITVAKEKGLWQADGSHSGFYRNLADRLTDFVLSPPKEGKWAQQLKSAGTLYFLGGNLSFGLVNLSSLPMNTVPWLSAHAPYTQAFATVLSTFKTVAQQQRLLRDVSKLSNRALPIEGIETDLRTALIQAAEDGTTLDTEIHHLMGLTKGQQFTNSRKVQKAMDAWMLPFRLSEQLNRITTFSSAWRLGRDVKKLTGRDLYKFAQEAVTSTQGRYDEANRPGFGQSPLWSTLFMFKSFPIFMIEMIVTLHKQSPAAAVRMLLGLTMAAGVTGLPFAEDVMDVVDVVSQRLFGSAFNSKRAIRNTVKDASEALVGADLSNLFLNGAINDWLGVNLSTRVGLGNLIPGTRLGAADNDYKRTLEEVLGPAGGMLTAAAGGLDHLTKFEFMDALKAGTPVAARNVVKGVQQLASGEAVDTQGRKLMDVNGWQAFWQTIGFTSSALNKVYQMDRIDRESLAYYNQVREDFGKHLIQAVRTGDANGAQDIMEAVQAWNERNPEMPISFAAPLMRRRIAEAGLPLNERTLRLLPRQLRGTSIAVEGMPQ